MSFTAFVGNCFLFWLGDSEKSLQAFYFTNLMHYVLKKMNCLCLINNQHINKNEMKSRHFHIVQ